MMTDLDQISVMIGELRSDVRTAVRWMDKHEEADERRFKDLAARIENLGIPLSRLAQAERDIAAAVPVVEGVKRLKWVAAGFMASIALLGGAIGGTAATVLKWFA